MFLRPNQRTKDGKTHTYWNVVENRRLGNGKIVQRQVLYLGEISSAQTELWQRAISDVTGPGKPGHGTPLLSDRASHIDVPPIQVRLSQMRLCRPRQFGSCWLVISACTFARIPSASIEDLTMNHPRIAR